MKGTAKRPDESSPFEFNGHLQLSLDQRDEPGAVGPGRWTFPGGLGAWVSETRVSVHWVQLGYIRRYRDWSIANRPKATKPRATAVSKNLPNGCAAIVCSVPSRPGAFCRSKVSAA